jgi:hypothetical protein
MMNVKTPFKSSEESIFRKQQTGYNFDGYQTLKSLPGNNLEELTWSQK